MTSRDLQSQHLENMLAIVKLLPPHCRALIEADRLTISYSEDYRCSIVSGSTKYVSRRGRQKDGELIAVGKRFLAAMEAEAKTFDAQSIEDNGLLVYGHYAKNIREKFIEIRRTTRVCQSTGASRRDFNDGRINAECAGFIRTIETPHGVFVIPLEGGRKSVFSVH